MFILFCLMAQPVVLDVETQKTFREVGGFEPKKLKISVAGAYDYTTDTYKAYEEHELPQLFQLLEKASTIIGFNIVDFDLPALSPYYVGDLRRFPTLDLLVDIETSLGHRLALDDLVKETLAVAKTGHGLLAIEYFRSGQMQKLKDYCLSDVRLTKELYEYGKKHGKVFYKAVSGRREIVVPWTNAAASKSTVNLTLPW